MDITAIKPAYYLGWYIGYLFLWYLIYYVTMRLFTESTVGKYSVLLTVGVAILICCGMLRGRQAFAFTLGVFLSDARDSKASEKFYTLKYCMISGAVGLTALAAKQIPSVRNMPQPLANLLEVAIATGVATAFILAICFLRNVLNMTPLHDLGVISYELYLTHGYTLWMVNLRPLNTVLFFGLTITVAVVSHALIKGIQQGLTRFAYRRE